MLATGPRSVSRYTGTAQTQRIRAHEAGISASTHRPTIAKMTAGDGAVEEPILMRNATRNTGMKVATTASVIRIAISKTPPTRRAPVESSVPVAAGRRVGGVLLIAILMTLAVVAT